MNDLCYIHPHIYISQVHNAKASLGHEEILGGKKEHTSHVKKLEQKKHSFCQKN